MSKWNGGTVYNFGAGDTAIPVMMSVEGMMRGALHDLETKRHTSEVIVYKPGHPDFDRLAKLYGRDT